MQLGFGSAEILAPSLAGVGQTTVLATATGVATKATAIGLASVIPVASVFTLSNKVKKETDESNKAAAKIMNEQK